MRRADNSISPPSPRLPLQSWVVIVTRVLLSLHSPLLRPCLSALCALNAATVDNTWEGDSLRHIRYVRKSTSKLPTQTGGEGRMLPGRERWRQDVDDFRFPFGNGSNDATSRNMNARRGRVLACCHCFVLEIFAFHVCVLCHIKEPSSFFWGGQPGFAHTMSLIEHIHTHCVERCSTESEDSWRRLYRDRSDLHETMKLSCHGGLCLLALCVDPGGRIKPSPSQYLGSNHSLFCKLSHTCKD